MKLGAGERRYYPGYRFVEHQSLTTQSPLRHQPIKYTQPPPASGGQVARAADWLGNWQSAYAATDDPLRFSFQTFTDGSAQARVVENNGMPFPMPFTRYHSHAGARPLSATATRPTACTPG